MAVSKAAARYATALLDLAIEMKTLENVSKDMIMLHGLCEESRDLVAFLQSPIIQKRRKYGVFDALFKGKVEDITLKFLHQITKNSRERIFPQIAESFIKQYRKHKGILDVQVKSAVKLEDSVKKKITAQVQRHFEGDIHLHETIDESLIGGFIVTIESEQIDASIRSQLANMKNILLN